jgi:hypothetical protein
MKPYQQHILHVECGYMADGTRKCPDFNLRVGGKFVCSFDLKVKEKHLGGRMKIGDWFKKSHKKAAGKYKKYRASIVSYFRQGEDRQFRMIENVDGDESDSDGESES